MVCPTYYRYNARFNSLGSLLFFQLPFKILEDLEYYGLDMFVSLTGSGPVLTAMEFHYYREGDYEKAAEKDQVVYHDFLTGKVYSLNEESVQGKSLVMDFNGVL